MVIPSKVIRPQSSLLTKPLTPRRCTVPNLQHTLHKAWILHEKFRVQKRPDRLFVIGFDLTRYRNPVFWGVPRYHNRAPVVIQDYDGFACTDIIHPNEISLFLGTCHQYSPDKREA